MIPQFSDSDTLWDLVDPSRKAATLILLYNTPKGLYVTLTQRAANMRSHPGDTALPGGHTEFGESCEETAFREAREEIGFDPKMFHLKKLGEMPLYFSISSIVVRPVVYLITGYKSSEHQDQHPQSEHHKLVSLSDIAPKLEPAEVADVFAAPLGLFSKGSEPDLVIATDINGADGFYYEFYLRRESGEPHCIRGLTASMLVDLARLVYKKEPQFPVTDDLGQLPAVHRALRDKVIKSAERL